MNVAGVLAGCAPGEPDCTAGTLPGLDAWFVVLVLVAAGLVLLVVAAGAVRFLWLRPSRRPDTASSAEEPVVPA
jgi:hypothetical protein